jgi:hypothetical protein
LYPWKRLFDALSVMRTLWFYIVAILLLAGGGTLAFFQRHPKSSLSLIIVGLLATALAVHRSSRNADFVILKVEPDITSDPKITYKSKLRIALRNQTGKQLRISYVQWSNGRNATPVNPAWYCLQLQDPAGFWESGHWGPETKDLLIPPDEAFRVSVALPLETTDAQIRSNLARKSLGILRLVPNGSDQPKLNDIRV